MADAQGWRTVSTGSIPSNRSWGSACPSLELPVVATPRIQFSGWTPWTRRGELAAANSSGVYLLAHFRGKPPGGPADAQTRQIVYVGMTGKTPGRTTLTRRWRAFERSGSSGRLAHSGGGSYFREFSGIRPQPLRRRIHTATHHGRSSCSRVRPICRAVSALAICCSLRAAARLQLRIAATGSGPVPTVGRGRARHLYRDS